MVKDGMGIGKEQEMKVVKEMKVRNLVLQDKAQEKERGDEDEGVMEKVYKGMRQRIPRIKNYKEKENRM